MSNKYIIKRQDRDLWLWVDPNEVGWGRYKTSAAVFNSSDPDRDMTVFPKAVATVFRVPVEVEEVL
jgi:hypothetical protein